MSDEIIRLEQRFGRFASVSAAALIVSQLMALVLTKLLTLGLSQIDYGVFALVISLGTLLGSLSSSLFTNGLWRYTEKYRTSGFDAKVGGVLKVAIILITALNALFILILMLMFRLLGNESFPMFSNPSLTFGVFMVAFSISSSCYNLIIALASGDQNSRLMFGSTITYASFQVVPAAIGVVIGLNWFDMFSIISISSFLGVILIFLPTLKQFEIKSIDKQEIRRVIAFGIPLALRGFFTSGTLTYLLLVAASFSDFALAGIVSVGFSVLALFQGVLQNFFSSFRQYAIATHEAFKQQRIPRFDTTRVSVLIFHAIIMGAMWIYALAPELVLLLSTYQYAIATEFIRISVIGMAILWTGYLYGTIGVYLAEKTYLETLSAGLGFLTAILASGFLMSWGLVGLAFVYVLSFSVTGITNIVSGSLSFRPMLSAVTALKLLTSVVLMYLFFTLTFMFTQNHILSAIVVTIAIVIIQERTNVLDLTYLDFILPFREGKRDKLD